MSMLVYLATISMAVVAVGMFAHTLPASPQPYPAQASPAADIIGFASVGTPMPTGAQAP